MQRFLLDVSFKETLIIKEKDFIHQLLKVLRGKLWDKIILFNGRDNIDHEYEIISILKNEVSLKLWTIHEKIVENTKINLYNACPNKLNKIELILQKWCEVWVDRFIFFRSERSQDLFVSENKLDRLEKIIIEATEQSGRNILPEFEIKSFIKFPIEWQFFHTKSADSVCLWDINFKEKKRSICLFDLNDDGVKMK